MKKVLLSLLLCFGLFAAEEKSFIQQHRPTFIAFGDNKMNTLVQFSFKYELLRNSNFYLGYTQYSVWEIWKESSPFRDHNFNPELFYRLPSLEKYLFFLDVGYEHKSNGRESGGADRTYDAPYLAIEKVFTPGPFVFALNAKGYYLMRTFGKPELVDYLGYAKFGARLGFDIPWLEHEEFFVNYIPARTTDKATWEAGAKFKTPLGDTATPYIFVQYWNGYLASLLDYDVYSQGFRAGLIFYRD